MLDINSIMQKKPFYFLEKSALLELAKLVNFPQGVLRSFWRLNT